jgi:hypothetical protein
MATCFTDIIKDFDHDILAFQETMKKYYTNKFFFSRIEPGNAFFLEMDPFY